MRTPVLTLLLLLISTPARTQEIRGVVVEDESGKPITDVTIVLMTEGDSVRGTAVTATVGWFNLRLASPGRYYLRASHELYRTSSDLWVTVNRQEIVNVVVRMGRVAFPLEPLVVSARSRDRMSGFRERASGRGQGRYILRPEIERRMLFRPSDLFKMEAGVRIDRVVIDGVSTDMLTMRSFGEVCEPMVYVDGVPLPPRIGAMGFSMDDMVSVDEMEGVEIYRSSLSAPMEFQNILSNCGVIAIWTKPPRRSRSLQPTWVRVGLAAMLAATMFLVVR
jgi:hypothetical protein